MGSATVVDHFIMVNLPFEEDIRTYSFPPLVPPPRGTSKAGGGLDLAPSPAQAKAALSLVRGMDLGMVYSGGAGKAAGSSQQVGADEEGLKGGAGGGMRVGELLRPEETANPALQRFYRALGRLALGQEEVKGREDQIPGPGKDDKLVKATLETPWDVLPVAARSGCLLMG